MFLYAACAFLRINLLSWKFFCCSSNQSEHTFFSANQVQDLNQTRLGFCLLSRALYGLHAFVIEFWLVRCVTCFFLCVCDWLDVILLVLVLRLSFEKRLKLNCIRKFCFIRTHLSSLEPAVLGAVVNFAISTQTDIITSAIQKKKKKKNCYHLRQRITRLYRSSVTKL